MIGGGRQNVNLRIVAEHADIWNSFGDPEQTARKNGILDDWCARVGRDPKQIERSILIRPDRIRSADKYIASGITHLILGFTGPDYNLSPLKKLVAWRDSLSRG